MNIKSRIEIYTGDLTDFEDNILGELLAQSVNNAYSALPDSLLIESTHTPVKLSTSQATWVSAGSSVIYVTRKDTDGNRRLCLEVNPLHWSKYEDTDSIYFATSLNPVYSIINESGIPTLVIAPAPSGAIGTEADVAYVYWRANNTNLGDQLENNQLDYFPELGLKFVILNTALLVLGLKLQIATLDEEDQELAQLTQVNMQAVKGQLDAELQRLKREESTPFDDQAIQQMENPTKGKSTKR